MFLLDPLFLVYFECNSCFRGIRYLMFFPLLRSISVPSNQLFYIAFRFPWGLLLYFFLTFVSVESFIFNFENNSCTVGSVTLNVRLCAIPVSLDSVIFFTLLCCHRSSYSALPWKPVPVPDGFVTQSLSFRAS